MGQYLLFFYGWLVNFKGASLPPHVFISGTALTYCLEIFLKFDEIHA